MTLLLYVAALFEGGQLLLAGAGQAIAVGNPLYLLAGFLLMLGYAVAAGAVVRGRRWGRRALVAAEWVRLSGFALSVLAGLLPTVETTVTVMGLLDGVALPIAVIVLARRVLPPVPRAAPPVATTLVLPAEAYR